MYYTHGRTRPLTLLDRLPDHLGPTLTSIKSPKIRLRSRSFGKFWIFQYSPSPSLSSLSTPSLPLSLANLHLHNCTSQLYAAHITSGSTVLSLAPPIPTSQLFTVNHVRSLPSHPAINGWSPVEESMASLFNPQKPSPYASSCSRRRDLHPPTITDPMWSIGKSTSIANRIPNGCKGQIHNIQQTRSRVQKVRPQGSQMD